MQMFLMHKLCYLISTCPFGPCTRHSYKPWSLQLHNQTLNWPQGMHSEPIPTEKQEIREINHAICSCPHLSQSYLSLSSQFLNSW
jgi:hypothetical protein